MDQMMLLSVKRIVTFFILLSFLVVFAFGFLLMSHSMDCMTADCPIVSMISATPVMSIFVAVVLIFLSFVVIFYLSLIPVVVAYSQSPNLKLLSTPKSFYWLALLENSPSK